LYLDCCHVPPPRVHRVAGCLKGPIGLRLPQRPVGPLCLWFPFTTRIVGDFRAVTGSSQAHTESYQSTS